MLIRQLIPLTVVPPRVIAFYLVILSSLGVVRNNLLLPAPVLKLSIMLLLTPPLSSISVGSYRILVQLRHQVLLNFVIVRVWLRLRTMMNFTSALNTLRSTIILCIIISCRELCTFVLLLMLISWLMCSPKHIHLNVSVILFPNSSWLQHYHLEFAGGC
jgi:hypothetical protein